MQLIEFGTYRFVSETDLSKVLRSDNFTRNEKWVFLSLSKMQNQCNLLFTDFVDFARMQMLAIEKPYDDKSISDFVEKHKVAFIQYHRYLMFYFTHEEEIQLIRKKLLNE